MLEQVPQPLQEGGRLGAVGDAVVAGEGQLAGAAGDDAAVRGDDGPPLDGAGREDRRLRRVDHGLEAPDPEHAQVGDREGAVAQVVEPGLPRPGLLDQLARRRGDLEDGLAVGVEDRRHEQRVVRGHGDPDVDPAEADDLAVDEAGVERRELPQRERGRPDQEVVQGGQRRAAELAQVVAEVNRTLHVDFDLERELGNLRAGGGHPLGDRALRRRQLDDRLLAAPARLGCRRRGARLGRRGRHGAAHVGLHDAPSRAAAVDPVEGHAELGGQPPGDRSRAGARARLARSRGGRGARAVDGEPRDHRAQRGRLALADRNLAQHAVDLGLVDHRRLVRLDLDERLAFRDRLAGPLEPAQDGGLLHRVGQPRHGHVDEPAGRHEVSTSSVAERIPRAPRVEAGADEDQEAEQPVRHGHRRDVAERMRGLLEEAARGDDLLDQRGAEERAQERAAAAEDAGAAEHDRTDGLQGVGLAPGRVAGADADEARDDDAARDGEQRAGDVGAEHGRVDARTEAVRPRLVRPTARNSSPTRVRRSRYSQTSVTTMAAMKTAGTGPTFVLRASVTPVR